MRRFLNAVLVFVAVFSVAPAAFAAQSKSHKTNHTVSGSIESYDATAHTLTMKMSTAAVVFHVAEAKVWVDSKSVTTEELAAQTGKHATVTYTVKGSDKKATTVRIATATATAKAAK